MSRDGVWLGAEVSVRRVDAADVQALKDRNRAEAGCQIVRDSILARRLADAYLIELCPRPGDAEEPRRAVGYAGVWNRYSPGRIMELYLLPEVRDRADELLEALVAASGATAVEAQTNLPQPLAMLERYATDVGEEKILFADGAPTQIEQPGVRFRRRRPDDEGPEGEWVLAERGRVVAAGGALRHYNPPYCDVYMEVAEAERRRGLGSYLVQELRRMSRAEGLIPAARCDPANEASRRALLRGGFVECGRIVVGSLS